MSIEVHVFSTKERATNYAQKMNKKSRVYYYRTVKYDKGYKVYKIKQT